MERDLTCLVLRFFLSKSHTYDDNQIKITLLSEHEKLCNAQRMACN